MAINKTIVLIHQGKATLPEIRAYSEYFGEKGYTVKDKQITSSSSWKKIDGDILWFFMGFYLIQPSNSFIVHDYRSLSTGRYAKIKNWMKRHLIPKPSIRIYLNQLIQHEFKFEDQVPFIYLDMGIPVDLLTYQKPEAFEYDFAYVGEISAMRGIDKMLDQFAKHYPKKKLVLIGRYQKTIWNKYRNNSSIRFTGQVSQAEVFKLLNKTDTCISFLPKEYPYELQTPTKLLEYAALGKRIIMNDAKSNIMTADKFNINALVFKGLNFPSNKKLEEVGTNCQFDSACLAWKNIIQGSGIENFLPAPV